MDKIFNSIYCPLFQKLFGEDLSYYLMGDYSSNQTNLLIPIGFSMIGISLLTAIVYYYIVNKPKLSLWWGWTIFLGINAILNFLVGWQWVLQHQLDEWPNSEVVLEISTTNVVMFGVANMLISLVVFFIFSLLIKWGSRNCSHAPF